MTVASPCVGVCTLDPATGWCLGCARTLDEISEWAQADDTRRRAILDQIATRQATNRE